MQRNVASLAVFGAWLFLLALPLGAGAEGIETRLKLAGGYRLDHLDWNIAGYADSVTYVNVLSELTWSDLSILLFGADLEIGIGGTRLLLATGFGPILDGENRDSDYDGDDRTQEWSRSISEGNGSVVNLILGAGYRFPLSRSVSLTPLAGLAAHWQLLRMTDGYLEIRTDDGSPGPIEGLDSSYNAGWYGGWLGLELELRPAWWLTSFTQVQGHLAFYYAWANWNLRDDFKHPKSFEHLAIGTGLILSQTLSLALSQGWSLELEAGYRYWVTGAGTDRTFFSNGSVSETRLNEVNWRSFFLTLGAAFRLSDG